MLDDWGLALLDDARRRDLLELLDERYQTRATVITSQLPVAHWHEALGDPTLADAILDRLVHHAHPLHLAGESLRKLTPSPTVSSAIDAGPMAPANAPADAQPRVGERA